MAAKISHAWNFWSFVFYFCAVAGVLFLCSLLAGPLLSKYVMFFSAIWSTAQIWQNRRLMESHLRRHGDSHEFSPNLRRIVDELCRKAGKDPAKVPIYDYSLNRDAAGVSKSNMRKLGRFLLTGRSHAAATAGGMLMASEPLLRLLDDAEEKAIFAHEMAHMVLRHYWFANLLLIIRRMVYHVVYAAYLFAAWQAGWAVLAVALGMPFALYYYIKWMYPAWRGRMQTVEDRKQAAAGEFWYLVTGVFLISLLLGLLSPPVLMHYIAFLLAARMAGVIGGLYSQSCEHQADAGAVALGGNPLALAMALRKMAFLRDRAQRKLFEAGRTSDDGLIDRYIQLYASHPRLEDRVENLCQMAYRSGTPWEEMQKVRRGDIDLPADHDIPDDVVRVFNQM